MFLCVINNSVISSSKTLLTTERRLTVRYFVALHHSPTFLNIGTSNETFQQSGKQDNFRQILQSSASMYQSSGSQVFRTTTGIRSGPDAFDESRFVVTFLIIPGVMEILCSFRLVVEGKTGKEMPESSRLEFLEKFLANNFALSDAEANTSGKLNKGRTADLLLLTILLAIHQKSREPCFWEVMMDSCFISICKFGSFKNPFAMITSLSKLSFRFRIFILLVQPKKSYT